MKFPFHQAFSIVCIHSSVQPCSQPSEALVPPTRERRMESEGERLREDCSVIHPPAVATGTLDRQGWELGANKAPEYKVRAGQSPL